MVPSDCKSQSGQSDIVNTNDRPRDLIRKKRSYTAENGPAQNRTKESPVKRANTQRDTSNDQESRLSPGIPSAGTDYDAEDFSTQAFLSEEQEIARRRALRAAILAKYKALPSTEVPPIRSEAAVSMSSSGATLPDVENSFKLTKAQRVSGSISDRQEDHLAAADFDPNADRIEEHHLHRARHHDQLHNTQPSDLDSTDPQNSGNIETDDDDMFADTTATIKSSALTNAENTVAQKLDESMLDSWADTEGYYRIMIGELLDGRYAVQSILGKGVFSAVVKAIDQETGVGVAVKVIRNNDLMRKAGLKEINILETLMKADPDDRKHIVRLKTTFEHRGHLCLVFESLSLNLREVLKKFGRDVGINLKAVRAYAQQIFLGLSLMRKCNVMHADLKPDNILVSESRTLLKICDLGSASDISENALTPYLASRFYRAPEVILGLPYDAAMDVWAIGCTLYEMFTGKILFPGRSNNQMLRLFMELRGKLPQKLLKRAAFTSAHFDDQFNFNSAEVDDANEKIVRVLTFAKPVKDLKSRLLAGTGPEERAMLVQFIDLLERCLELDSSKRIIPTEALKHPFLARVK